MPTTETFCPWCDAVAEVRGKTRSLPAPVGWYRCPECFAATLGHELPVRKKLGLLQGQPPRFPVVTSLGSVSSDTPATTTLSLGIVTASPGDVLIAQVVVKHGSPYDPNNITVSWGSASISMLAPGFNYGLTGDGTDTGRSLYHRVVATQTAELAFSFSGTVADHRVICAIKVSGLGFVDPAIIAPGFFFDDEEEFFGYPYTIQTFWSVQNPDSGANWSAICHAQASSTPASWNDPFGVDVTRSSSAITNTILTTRHPHPGTQTFTAASGPAAFHGTGFFGFHFNP